jgi:hypothetical protein
MGIQNLDRELIGNNEDRKKSQINVIYPISFHLNRIGHGNNHISSEENFENSKTRRVSYLLL